MPQLLSPQELGVALFIILPALALAAIAHVWMIIQAFRAGVLWGLAVLFIPPVVLLFIPFQWKKARGPLALFMFACVVYAVGLVVAALPVSRDERVKMVDGEKHVTLTRAKADYVAVLKKHPDVVVLQMAECDVDDETLQVIGGLSKLRELDLNSNPITDDGLAHLAGLADLEILRLNQTKITDEGFEKHVATLPKLKEVNVRLTEVKSATARAWVKKGKEAGIERKQTSGK